MGEPVLGGTGLARRRISAGAKWGGICFGVVAAAYLVALAVPQLRPLITDARVGGLDGGEVAYRVLVRIPLGTVLWEEVAFRGVLLAALARLSSLRVAVAISAGVFGLWHIRPTLGALAAKISPTAHLPPHSPYSSAVWPQSWPASYWPG